MKNKGLVTTLVVVGLGAAAYFLFLKGKGGSGGGRGGGGKTSDLDFLSMANKIFDAMDGYGTNEGTIENELKKLKSIDDWNALVSAYGTRTINCGTWNPFCTDFTGGLVDCLKDELTESEEAEANQILNKIGVSL